ncbi:MAG: PD-(D/E)XK nuclease family protein [candidate division Zixibacteria bacterium]|nr:PD-(D/E)XK nuclease family protein [candidate division Zixibacteria bacterium]
MKLEQDLKRPNLLSIFRVEDNELTHSNVLAWLLDPRGNHGLGGAFLKQILKVVFGAGFHGGIDEFEIDSMNLRDVQILREWQNIDLFIHADRFTVCIENKLWSGEHSNQLSKYRHTITSAYPKHQNAFVYLTPYGAIPTDGQDACIYQTMAYSDVTEQLEQTVRIHREKLSARVLHLIEDYITVIRRRVMKEDAVNELARKVYEAHREALDFIFENKPDRLYDVAHLFDGAVQKQGWTPIWPNKGYAHFLTPDLRRVLPMTGGTSAKKRESFIFEIDYWSKYIIFKTIIVPGDEKIRGVLSTALSEIEGAVEPKGDLWLVHLTKKWAFEVAVNSDKAIDQKIQEIWPEIVSMVERVEKQILKAAQLFAQESS